jgi:hypothetical protein
MRAGMVSRAGDASLALRLWTEVRDDPSSDAASVAIAERQVRDLTVRVDLQRLRSALSRFRDDNGTYPRRLEELTRGGYLESLPVDPSGRPYEYDPRTGAVGSIAGRVLGES